MDRGIRTEEVLAERRQADPPMQYLVGTPKGRLTRLEKEVLGKPWQDARPGLKVKLLPQDGELYVFAQSVDGVAKERSMRGRQLKWLWARLKQLATMALSREELLMKLGAARARAPTAWRLVAIEVAPDDASLTYRLDRAKLHQARRREGRYLLAPISRSRTRPSRGACILSPSASKKRSRTSKATSPSGRSSTRSRPASRRLSSSPSWHIVAM